MLTGRITGWMVTLATLITLSSGQQLRISFGETDYSDSESLRGTNITVTKEDTNVADLFLNIRFLTIDQYNRTFGCENLPTELACTGIDPAEPDDFISDERQIVFPPSDTDDEITFSISFEDDDINEAGETYYVVVSVDQVLSSDVDSSNVVLNRNGVARINIVDDDVLTLSFEMMQYVFPEGAGVVNDVVNVIKNDGMETEQFLPVAVSLTTSGIQDPATEGPSDDFTIDDPLPLVLEFAPTESRLSVPMTINDDQLLEPSRESFFLQLSIPQNPPTGYALRAPTTATVNIDDDEEGRVGIEQETYVVNEGDGFVEVCFVLFEPSDANLLDMNAFAEFGWQTNNGTALGEGEDYETFIAAVLNRPFISRDTPRVCFNITIIDDIFDEGTEEFTVAISLDVNDPVIFPPTIIGNFIIDPVNATIVIMDNDGPITVTPSPEETTTVDSDTGNGTSTTEEPTTTTEEPPTNATTTEQTTTAMGGDPHYSILLPTGQNLCYSVQGEHGFTFNLISNNKMQMNAMFVPDARREEITWIGALGIVLKNVRYKTSNKTKIRFVASENMLYVGEEMSLNAEMVDKLEFSNGKLRISEADRKRGSKRLDVEVDLRDIGLKFTVRFVKKCHLDMFWNEVVEQPRNSHGMIGQFFRSGVEIDETRRLLLLPTMEPVPVMRKPVWHFMEREEAEDKMCWVAMNPGYQGKKLLEGHYLDYLVNDVLSTKFKFKFNPSK